MDIAHIYIGIERMTIPAAKWVILIKETLALKGVGDAAHEQLQPRGNLDVFEHVSDDPETPEDETVLISDIYTFEANFPANAVSFDKFKNRLAVMFDKDPEDIICTIGTATIRDRPSCFATYNYLGVDRIKIGLFGCASDSELCTTAESRVECEGYISKRKEVWETVQ